MLAVALSGRIRAIEWHERIADCYIAKFGADERPFHDARPILLDRCPFYSELSRLFEAKGARVRLSSLEKIEWVDLKQLATGDPSGFGDAWRKRHRNNKGRVPIAAVAYFDIDPASSRIAVEVWRDGDIGSTVIFAEALETEIYGYPRFVQSAGKRPGSLIVTVTPSVELVDIGARAQSWYRVEFATHEGKSLGGSSGACWTEELAKCAKRVREDAELAATRMSVDAPSTDR